jgi:hypothetical protein
MCESGPSLCDHVRALNLRIVKALRACVAVLKTPHNTIFLTLLFSVARLAYSMISHFLHRLSPREAYPHHH